MRENYLFNFIKNKGGLLLFLIVINLIIKLPLLFIPIDFGDIAFYRYTGQLFLEGYIPYKDFNKSIDFFTDATDIISLTSLHPNGPLNYYIYFLIVYLFGDSPFSIKIPIFVSEIVCVIMIYKIGEIIKSEKIGFYSALFYSICSITFFPMLTYTTDETISSAFVLSSIYLFIKRKNIESAILLALSTSYKYYSLLLLIPIFLYCKKNLTFKKFVQYIIVFIATILVVALPFLIICPYDLIYWNLIQFSRFMNVSFGVLLRNSVLYYPIIELDLVSISLLNVIQFIIVLISSLYFFKIFKKQMDKLDFLLLSAFYISILPGITLTNNFRYMIWLLPFISIPISIEIMETKESNFDNFILLSLIIFGTGNLIFLFIFPNLSEIYEFFLISFLILIFTWMFLNLYLIKRISINFLLIFAIFLNGVSNFLFYFQLINITYLSFTMPYGVIILYASECLIFLYIFKKIEQKSEISSFL